MHPTSKRKSHSLKFCKVIAKEQILQFTLVVLFNPAILKGLFEVRYLRIVILAKYKNWAR